MHAIAQLTATGVFDRFPELKFYFAETQASWLPHTFAIVDAYYQVWCSFGDLHLKKMPSEYYRDHCRFSFIRDPLAMKFRYLIGLDLMMWGSDFPHAAGTFPYSRAYLDDYFDSVPDVERRKVLVDNVCEFFGLDSELPITATP
jgi:predicted TIM-barrel fold metal-dependent hydrolase